MEISIIENCRRKVEEKLNKERKIQFITFGLCKRDYFVFAGFLIKELVI